MIRKDYHRPWRTAATALAWLAAGLGSASQAQIARAATPAGTVISTLVSASYQASPYGAAQILTSNLVSVTVTAPPVTAPPVTPAPVTPTPPRTAPVPVRTVGVALTPASSAQKVSRPMRSVYPISVRNTGNGADSVTFNLTRPIGWNAALVYDTYGDATLHASGNTPVPSKVALSAGQSQALLLVVTPPLVLMRPAVGTFALMAVSGADSKKTAQATVTTTSGAGVYTGH